MTGGEVPYVLQLVRQGLGGGVGEGPRLCSLVFTEEGLEGMWACGWGQCFFLGDFGE